MKYALNTFSSLVVVAALAVTSITEAFAAEILVVDPISGDTVPVTEIAFDSLTEDQRKDVGDQLAEQGVNAGPGQVNREDLSDVEVVDPTTGETVSLADLDISELSDEDRRSVGDQLAEQGVNPGRGGEGHGNRPRN